jgi:predicted amidohydrolase YtcJ
MGTGGNLSGARLLSLGARVLQADGKTIMPGLINVHMHIGGSGAFSIDPREFTPTAAANNFKGYLTFRVKYGITSPGAHPLVL